MYSPSHFNESRLDVLHGLIDAHPLGALVTHGAHGLCADHVPFEICAATPDAPHGTLRAHVARANPLWQQAGLEALAIFQGPAAYVSPSWYEEKETSGKVVPTFNYAVVHAHGTLRAIDDRAWLLAQLERMTVRREAGHAMPWQLADAPREFIDKLLGAIVGIEIVLARVEGKWKVSQNRTPQDRANIAAGLAGQPGGGAMAALMK